MSGGASRARAIAAFAATAPKEGAERAFNEPPNLPIGVRTAERIATRGNAVDDIGRGTRHRIIGVAVRRG
jgi:hypothetical protein